MKTRLGRQESLLLAHAQMRGLRQLRTGDLTAPLRLTPQQERELFRRMARSGLVARVRKGLYLVPPQLPLGLSWSPGPAEAINALMDDCGGSYQLCGPNAFNRYGFDDQIPNRLYVYNNRISGDRRVAGIEMTLIKVAASRLGETDTVVTPDGSILIYSSRGRSLVDAIYDWSRFDGIPRGYRWIQQELAAKRVKPANLAALTLRYGDIGAIRRMGMLFEQIGVGERILRQLSGQLPATTCPIPYLPNRPKRGPANLRWGIVLNEATKAAR